MAPFTRLCASLALAATVAAPASAFETDPKPGLADFFSIDRIGTFIANTAIAALRTQMELEYAVLSTDLTRGSVSVSGVIARPLLPYDQARQCVINIDRAVIASDIAKPFEVASEVTINLIGARASTACLPPEAAMAVRASGMREIALDQFKIRAAYVYATGETSADATIAINDFAVLDFSGSGMILPRLGDYGPGDPAIRVMRAVASLKDRGGWARVSQMLPQNLIDPETIRQIGTETVTQALSSNGSRALTAVESNFVTELMARVVDFVTDPGEITIEADLPPGGIVIEPVTYNNEPEALVAALALSARATPLSRTRILSGADLATLANPEGQDPALLLRVARALLDGTGVPRSPALVPALLQPLMLEPTHAVEAAALIARALQDRDPVLAYGYALKAAAGGVVAAVPVLDQLENQMTSVDVLKAQADFSVEQSPLAGLPEDNDPRSLRQLSLAYFIGSGTPRSYAQAYYFALLAEAAGDINASALRQEVEGRFAARGDVVREAWDKTSADMQAKALQDWIGLGLADRYLTR